MKKTFFTLFLTIVLSSSIFAEQYFGASLSINYSRETQETNNQYFMEQFAGAGLGLSYGYYFGRSSTIGLLIDANMAFPLWHNYKENQTLYVNWAGKDTTNILFEVYPSLSCRIAIGESFLTLKAFPFFSAYCFDVSETSYKTGNAKEFTKAALHLENIKTVIGAGGEIFFTSNPMDCGPFLNIKSNISTSNTKFFDTTTRGRPNFQITLGYRVGLLSTEKTNSGNNAPKTTQGDRKSTRLNSSHL